MLDIGSVGPAATHYGPIYQKTEHLIPLNPLIPLNLYCTGFIGLTRLMDLVSLVGLNYGCY